MSFILPPLDTETKEQLSKAASTIRVLSMDAIQKARSGHPGLPLGCAELGAYIYGFLLRHNPRCPTWLNRDRFILSAGHGSMWLYSCLHLAGFDITLEDIKSFRQLNSKTAGHPESGVTPGVETTTGPLGQGFGNAVGTALGLKILGHKFNSEEFSLFSSKTFVLAGDGCIMEGISSEASSLAGHLNLNNLVVFYDANNISLDGPLEESCSENTKMRYQSYGWQVYEVNGHDFDQIDQSVRQAIHSQERPVLIIVKTTIGKGAPTKEGSHKCHGAPLGSDEITQAKALLGFPNEDFYTPQSVLRYFEKRRIVQNEKYEEWNTLFENWTRTFPEKQKQLTTMLSNSLPENLEELLKNIEIIPSTSGRKASQAIMDAISDHLPQLYAGSADLSSSDMTVLKKHPFISSDSMNGRNIKFGVREFSMGAMATGLRQTRMIQPVVGTFLTFSDYMRNAIRLASLMKETVIYHFTHDSIFLGEDGPTHQPVEHIASLRAIPNLQVIRPSGQHEVKMAWLAALRHQGPTALILSRQNIIDIFETAIPYSEGVGKGAYIIREGKEPLDYTIVSTGSELPLAIDVGDALGKLGKSIRVVSMPCWELFEAQSISYKASIFGPNTGKKISIEAGIDQGWHKYIGSDGIAISVEGFGASAPPCVLAKEYGFTVDDIIRRILA